MATPSRDTTASANPQTELPLRGRVVYIEDDETNVLLVRALVARHPGVELLHAATGRAGIELVRREKPDFVLLDMHLPDISGLEVVRELNIDITSRGLRRALTGRRPDPARRIAVR